MQMLINLQLWYYNYKNYNYLNLISTQFFHALINPQLWGENYKNYIPYFRFNSFFSIN
jgi:hypothetical protein